MIKALEAKTPNDIKIVFNAMGRGDPSNDIMFVYGYWDEDKCVGFTYLTKKPPHLFTIELKNATSISIGKAIGNMLSEAVKLKSSLLAQVSKYNFKSLKLCKQLGFRVIYTDHEYVTLEFRKEFWRYSKRWII